MEVVFTDCQNVQDRMIWEVNRVLSSPYDPYGAYLRRIDSRELSDRESLSYVLEVVPFSHVNGFEGGRNINIIATERFLRWLVKVVINFKMKYSKG